jgi:hypothetical protein
MIAMNNFQNEEIKKQLVNTDLKLDLTSFCSNLSSGQLSRLLKKSAKNALTDISRKECHASINPLEKGHIHMTLAIYGAGALIQTVFESELSQDIRIQSGSLSYGKMDNLTI